MFDSFFAKVHKKVQHYRVDVMAGDASAAAYQYYKKQKYQDLYNCRHVERNVMTDEHGPPFREETSY